jgi:hypothetical protein
MSSEYVSSTCNVGSSHVAPRESWKSWNGEVEAEGQGTVGRYATQRRQQPNDLNPHGRVRRRKTSAITALPQTSKASSDHQ